MKKVLSLLFIFILISVISVAQKVSLQQAKKAGTNFYYERTNQYDKISYKDLQITESFEIKDGNELVYYIFNFSDNGYVIVSATQKCKPVLGYSFKGHYHPDYEPVNFTGWMKHYAKEIEWLLQQPALDNDKALSQWRYYLTDDISMLQPFRDQRDVEPMITTTWNQNYPYNAHCPEDGAGPHGHCYAGCVATAMAQVMFYYRWPVTGEGSYTYSHPVYGEISANFENTTYFWDEMPNVVLDYNPAVAELLYHLGVSVDMDYGPNGSGMWNHKAAYSLSTHFKYSEETQYIWRDSTSMTWDSLVIAQLDKAMPCYYAGWGDYVYVSGHAFVVDGYQGGDYFHFNWGWGGSYDGYFTLDNLSPGGNNFNYVQELVINSYPDTINYEYPLYCQGPVTLTAVEGTFEDGSGPKKPYAPNADCSWLIDPQSIYDSITNITLSFNRFNTIEGDMVNVYDGPSENDPLLGSFEGSDLPDPVTSTGNKMLVTFNSGSVTTGNGWLASYETHRPAWCSGISNIIESSGNVSDGSGDFYYQNDLLCQWRILPSHSGSTTISFNSFDTEEGEDFVSVYDMVSQELLLETSGNTIPDPVVSESGKVIIMFVTDETGTAAGWDASFWPTFVGIDDEIPFSIIQLFPSPASNELNIIYQSDRHFESSFEIYDITGIKIMTDDAEIVAGNNKLSINTDDLSQGVYLLRFIFNQQVITKKFMICR